MLALSETLQPQLDALVAQRRARRGRIAERAICPASPRSARARRSCRIARRCGRAGRRSRDLPFRADLFAPFLADVETARTLPPLTPRAFAQIAARRAARVDAACSATTAGSALAHAVRRARCRRARGVDRIDARRGAPARSQGRVGIAGGRLSRAHPARARRRAALLLGADRDRSRCAAAPRLARARADVAGDAAGAGGRARVGHFAVAVPSGRADARRRASACTTRCSSSAPSPTRAEARRTLHATLVCVLSALLVFGMLAWSSLPVLRAIGLTVALGVGFPLLPVDPDGASPGRPMMLAKARVVRA